MWGGRKIKIGKKQENVFLLSLCNNLSLVKIGNKLIVSDLKIKEKPVQLELTSRHIFCFYTND